MSEHKRTLNAGEPLSEKIRLIRFRMSREHTLLSTELRLIPRKLFITLIGLYAIALGITQTVIHYTSDLPFPEYNRPLNALIAAGICTLASIAVAALILLTGYVYCDAKRRGMNATLWTLLVIILLPAWLGIGFIIYFLVREPLPYPCPQCGADVSARFNFCPRCKANLRPLCPVCRKEVRLGDRFCPNCAADLTPELHLEMRDGLPPSAGLGTSG